MYIPAKVRPALTAQTPAPASAPAGAVASVSAQSLIAVLAGRLGGLSIVVGYLSLLAIPNAIIVALLLPETRGLSLEAAAMEEAFEKSR